MQVPAQFPSQRQAPRPSLELTELPGNPGGRGPVTFTYGDAKGPCKCCSSQLCSGQHGLPACLKRHTDTGLWSRCVRRPPKPSSGAAHSSFHRSHVDFCKCDPMGGPPTATLHNFGTKTVLPGQRGATTCPTRSSSAGWLPPSLKGFLRPTQKAHCPSVAHGIGLANGPERECHARDEGVPWVCGQGRMLWEHKALHGL